MNNLPFRNAHLKGRLFNDYDLGGYLIWKLYPEQEVFIDGRLIEFGADMVRDSFYYWKPEVWQRLETQYGFTAAVIPMEQYYAAQHLDSRNDWVLVYWDDGALVYVKDVPENRAVIGACGYKILKPNSPWQGYMKEYPYPQVMQELQRSVSAAPHSRRARALKDFAARSSLSPHP